MEFDLMTGQSTWGHAAALALDLETNGWSGMVFTETSQTPFMQIAVASTAAPSLFFTTGVAVAFPRSPMVSAAIAWELAENTRGRFRLGLGSQVRAHVERRYGAEFDPPAARMKDYVAATKACIRAFRGDAKLDHQGPYYRLSLLPAAWRPRPHDHGDVKVDISAVGPLMVRAAAEVADGIHVHPLHSMHYIESRLKPQIEAGATAAGRHPDEIDLIVPVFAVVGDTHEEQEPLRRRARSQIAFYGSTKNYAFQFDDLGFEGASARLNELLKAGDLDGMSRCITDEMLEHYAVVASWDEIADALLARYGGTAARLVMYLAEEHMAADAAAAGKWGEIARAVRAG